MKKKLKKKLKKDISNQKYSNIEYNLSQIIFEVKSNETFKKIQINRNINKKPRF